MKIIIINIIVICCFLTSYLNAQIELIEPIKKSFNYKPKLYFNLDTRNSFITNSYAKIRGFKAGVNFNHTTKFAIGYNWLGSELLRETKINNQIVLAKLNLWYISPYFEYSFYKEKNIELSIPVHLGVGVSNYKYQESKTKNILHIIYEPAMTIQYRVLKYFAIGGGIGYRLLLTGNEKTVENFNSPIYILKFKIFFGDIYTAIFKKDK